MRKPHTMLTVGMGLAALAGILALSWGGYRAVKYLSRVQHEAAQRHALARQQQEQEQARQLQARRQEAAQQMPIITLGQSSQDSDGSVATAPPLKVQPKSAGGLSVMTLGDPPQQSSTTLQPQTLMGKSLTGKPPPAEGLSVVTLSPVPQSGNPPLQSLSPKGLAPSNIRSGLPELKIQTLPPTTAAPAAIVTAQLPSPKAISGTPPLTIASITAPATQPAAGLSPATLDQIAKELPPALEIQRTARQRPVPQSDDGMRIISGFECSATLAVQRIADTHFKVRFTGQRGSLDNYFLFRVEGVKDRTVRIDFEEAPLGKWWSLNPVYSYVTDLDDPENFRSVAVENPVEAIAAHNGPLLPDTRGEKWHFMPDVWSQRNLKQPGTDIGTLSMVHTFTRDSAYIGLKVPYTPGLNQRLFESLKGNPLVQVIHIGASPQGRPLLMAKIGGDEQADKTRPCVLMYAREHGTEQDSSWVVEGAMRFLLSDDPQAVRIRERFTFLLLPIMDPDGAAAGFYDRISYSFTLRDPSPEALAYATWFEQWVDAGKRLDVVLNLHNMESAEMEHLMCYYADPGRMEACGQLHQAILQQFSNDGGYRVNPRIREGYTITRLGGWLGYYFGPLPMLYEINSQEKEMHLSLGDTRRIAVNLLEATDQFFTSTVSTAIVLHEIDNLRKVRDERLAWSGRWGNAFETNYNLRWTISILQRQNKERNLPE